MNLLRIGISTFFSFVMVRSQWLLQVWGGPKTYTICEGISLRKIIQNYYSKLGAGPWHRLRPQSALRLEILSSTLCLLRVWPRPTVVLGKYQGLADWRPLRLSWA